MTIVRRGAGQIAVPLRGAARADAGGGRGSHDRVLGSRACRLGLLLVAALVVVLSAVPLYSTIFGGSARGRDTVGASATNTDTADSVGRGLSLNGAAEMLWKWYPAGTEGLIDAHEPSATFRPTLRPRPVPVPLEGWDDVRLGTQPPRDDGKEAVVYVEWLPHANKGIVPRFFSSPPKYTPEQVQPVEMRWRGLPVTIEPLLPKLHFRPRFFSGYTGNVENKEHIQLLGRQVDVSSAARRVLVDFGCRDWASSVEWFLLHYPVQFDEIHAFEENPDANWRIGEQRPTADLLAQRMVAMRRWHADMTVKVSDLVPEAMRMVNSVAFHNARVGIVDDVTSGPTHHVDAARFLRDELRITADDFVVVKIDIEGAEWTVIPRLREAGLLPLIDELMVEAHYKHNEMRGWDRFESHSLDDALAMLVQLRDEDGVFAHAWP